MEIRIGIQHAGREVVLESNSSPKDISKLVDEAIKSGDLLTLTDDKGRTIHIPGDKIAFVEVGAQQSGKVGFAS